MLAITAVTRLAVTCTRKGYANIFQELRIFQALEKHPNHEYQGINMNKRNKYKYCLSLPVP